MRWAALALVISLGCGAAPQHPSGLEDNLLPAQTFISELPDPPAAVPDEQRIVLPVSACEVEGGEILTQPGIYMSEEMAMRAAQYRVAYDELRGMYQVDQRTIERERDIYHRQLGFAEIEIEELREQARRSWLERNRGWLGVTVGVIVGAGLAVGLAAALEEAME